MLKNAKRKGESINSGTLSPNPWDLTLWGQNVWLYTGGTRTEDKAPQGCDLSADSSAGMTWGGFGRPGLQITAAIFLTANFGNQNGRANLGGVAAGSRRSRNQGGIAYQVDVRGRPGRMV